jgi:hypothetical protein
LRGAEVHQKFRTVTKKIFGRKKDSDETVSSVILLFTWTQSGKLKF